MDDITEMLYNCLTSNVFKLQVSAIVEGFTSLHQSYVQEKKAMEKIWKQREKQLETVLLKIDTLSILSKVLQV